MSDNSSGKPPFPPALFLIALAAAGIFGWWWGESRDPQLQDMTLTTVSDNKLHIMGTLNERSYGEITGAIRNNPDIDTVVLHRVSGTIDADTNFRTALFIQERGLDVFLPSNARVASGATHIICAGRERIAEYGAQIGVHSWSAVGVPNAADLDRDSSAHRSHVEFFSQTECGERFFWFSQDAAPAQDIHWMSEDEMRDYRVITKFVEN
ncbi:MAG: hypothetical protein MRY63_13885 [Neomegalonema sp.]|nr:hypothetical protein [Neomegalonema sp.]